MLAELAAVGAGGFLGACARFELTKRMPASAFPFSTLCANVTAGLLIGVAAGIDAELPLPPKLKLFITTGILGGLSTFSSFSLETVKLFQDGKMVFAGANVLLNLALSILGVIIGMAAVKMIRGLLLFPKI